MSTLSHTRDKIYKTVARQLHGAVPCWLCGKHVPPAEATLEHIKPLSEGGSSHLDNRAISHGACNNRRHARASSFGKIACAQGDVAASAAAGEHSAQA